MRNSRKVLFAAIGIMIGMTLLAGPAGAGSADIVTGQPFLSHSYSAKRSYDYNPSVIQSGTMQRFWWCGGGANPHHPGYTADNIYYAARDTRSGKFAQSPVSVFAEGTAGHWDDYLDCNPSVVGGNFAPFGDGRHYTLAMYYVANSIASGTNQIGVAFSNTGTSWRRWPYPVITRSNPHPGKGCYGVGSPSAYNIGRSGRVRLFYEDICNGGYTLYSAITPDGVNFAHPTTVTRSGLGYCNSVHQGAVPTDANMSYDPAHSDWYATMDLGCANGQRSGERGTIGFKLYKKHASSTGSLAAGSWQPIATVDTNSTGYEINSWPALRRDRYGNVALPNLEVLYTVANPLPPSNVSAAQGRTASAPQFWDISYSTIIMNQRNVTSLVRYRGATHDVTTGYANRAAFPVNEGSLGYLYEAPRSSTRALYNCQQAGTRDYFVSVDLRCEGQRIVGLEGYALTRSGKGELPLYRCVIDSKSGHFVSHDSKCEGHRTERLLGYAMAH